MANVRSSNTYYIDTASGSIASKNIKVWAVIITPTSANGQLVLQDSSTNDKKLDFRFATAGSSQILDLHNVAMVFPNGIAPVTVTNCVATLVLEETKS